MKILGIDSSLTGTGMCRAIFPDILVGVPPVGPLNPMVDLITVGARAPKKTDTWIHKSQRVHEVLDSVAAAMDEDLARRPDAVGLEELAYGAQGAAVVVLHWLWGEIIWLAEQREIPLYLVNVSGVKKFATGKGNAKKDEVMLAMANRYPQYTISDNNQSDALAVAMMTARHLGVEFDTMPQKNLEAMDKVAPQ